MPVFGARSKARLDTLDVDLRWILYGAILVTDFTVICGARSKEEQDEAFASGHSKVQWPNSKHNTSPSLAVDVAPWPIDWKDDLAFARLYGVIEACAFTRKVQLRWGGDWDGDGSSRDQTFMDIGHIEVVSSWV